MEALQEHCRSSELPAGYSEQRQFCEASLAEVLDTTPGYQNSSRVRPFDKDCGLACCDGASCPGALRCAAGRCHLVGGLEAECAEI
eukprot:9046335-Pyramimonas_sp.AAC.2